MKTTIRQPWILIGSLIWLFSIPGAALAAYKSPIPDFYADDTGLTSVTPASEFLVFSPEMKDGIAEFGLYITGSDLGDPASIGVLFDAAGHTGRTRVNFELGLVTDILGLVVFDEFTPNGSIGYYFVLDTGMALYSDPALNADGMDYVGIFHNLNPLQPDDYAVSLFDVATTDIELTTAAPVFSALIDAPQVPIPAALPLFASGLLGLVFTGLRRRRRT